MASTEPLTLQELAGETESAPDRIRALVAAGVLEPIGPDRFKRGDVQRVLVANALEEAGLSLEHMRRGIEMGIVSFDQTDVIYPDPGRLARGTVADLARDVGLTTDTLLRIITAFGIPRPDPGDHLHEPDEVQLRAFVEAWRPLGDDELLLRAARAYGDALRRAAEGWMSLFEEAVLAPVADRAVPWEEMSRLALEPGVRILEAGTSMLPWLLDQHRFQMLNRLNFGSIERMLTLSGVAVDAPRHPAAVLFADLAGYTRLTEERGDEAAAASAMRLAELADEVATAHGGRLVKLLGDGVMLHFPAPADAVDAALALRDAMAPNGLPPTHTGIAAGGVIRRGSDFFGSTVNIASRLAAAAGPGEILLTQALVQSVREAGGALPLLGDPEPMTLRGIPEPVAVFRTAG